MCYVVLKRKFDISMQIWRQSEIITTVTALLNDYSEGETCNHWSRFDALDVRLYTGPCID
jgi:hypothetical protein